MKQRIYCIISILIIFCLTASGCGNRKSEISVSSVQNSQAESEEQSDISDTLVIAGDTVTSLNPLLNGDNDITRLIFSGLLKYGKDGKVYTDLAESYSFDEETLTYTFYLRKGVVWQDGEMFTADDVVYTYNLLTQDETLDTDIKSNYENIASVEEDGPYTVKITVKEKCSFMPYYFNVGILPKNLLEGDNINTTAFNTAPIGTGQYRLVSWDEDQIVLEQNELYYADKSSIKKIIYKMTSGSSEKAQLLASDEAQMAVLDSQEAAEFSESSDYTLYSFETSEFYGISMDYSSKFWTENADSIYVLNYIIDKDSIIQDVLNGHGTAAYSPLQISNISSESPVAFSAKNFASEMKKLGWKKNSNGIYTRNEQTFTFTLQVTQGDDISSRIALNIQKQFQEAGIDLKIETVSELSWNGTYDGAVSTFDASVSPDALYKFFVTDASGNFMHYSNTSVDTWLQSARYETDSDKRTALYQKFEAVYVKDAIQIPIVYPSRYYVMNSDIKGIDTDLILCSNSGGILYNISDWYIESSNAQDNS